MARKATPPYRVGIVGVRGATGGIGGAHTRAAQLHPNTKIVAICDVNSAGFEPYRAAHGPVDGYTDITAMLDAHQLDIVCIGTSDHTHCELVEAACRAGVPMIFCEKPLDVTLERGDRIVKAVEESGATFLCDHTRRWMPTWVNGKKLLDERFGPVVTARAHMGGARAMLFRNGTHLIDTLCWYVGGEPVWLTGGEFEDLGVFDSNPSGTALIGFDNGCRALLDLSKKVPGEFLVDCLCENGRLVVDRNGIHLSREEPGLGLTQTPLPPSAGDGDGMVFAMRDLIAAYEEGRPTRSTVRDALRVLEIMTAMIRSSDNDGARITWPLDRATASASEGKRGYDASTLQWRK